MPLILAFILSLCLALSPVFADTVFTVEQFSPQGTVSNIRQVSARFSEQVVTFGDPRLVEPFDINCPEKGSGHWVDGKNWTYDFEHNLPAGVKCVFSVKSDLNSLVGKGISGQRSFSFSTGGPAVLEDYSREYGGAKIHEDQVFALMLSAEPIAQSVTDNVYCSVEGIQERIGVKIINGTDRENLLRLIKANRQYSMESKDQYMIFVQCGRPLPNDTKISLVWGKNVRSISGTPTEGNQFFTYQTRSLFTISFKCERENANADCLPIRPMRIEFSSPVPLKEARKITLKGSKGKAYTVSTNANDDPETEQEDSNTRQGDKKSPEFVKEVKFKGPFPEQSSFTLNLPANLKDDSGRRASNAAKFPLTVKTAEFPPLAKFSARFGIIELKGDATLPVTLRNLEPNVKMRQLKLDDEKKKDVVQKAKEDVLDTAVKIGEAISSAIGDKAPEFVRKSGNSVVQGLKGKLHKVRMGKEEKIIQWLKQVSVVDRRRSVFKGMGADSEITDFSLPKPSGAKAFEVVGIPLKKPGLYVVEMESGILGSSLLGERKPMFVPTVSLVTNMGVHFKWGRESSIAWVTTLDQAQPVNDAEVTIRDCNGKEYWKGKTDMEGIARITKQLPSAMDLPTCNEKTDAETWYDHPQMSALYGMHRGLFVFARKADDLAFVHSSWNKGIEAWRYGAGRSYNEEPVSVHTVFDRRLFRAGETVHMKHFMRKRTISGFSFPGETDFPKSLSIFHLGSEQSYDLPLKWTLDGIAETTWQIPSDAKLGTYETALFKKGKNKSFSRANYFEESNPYYPDGFFTGGFRVEEFKIALMKGSIQPQKTPLVNTQEAPVDLLVTYLGGGGAQNAEVTLRSRVELKQVSFSGYEDFVFSNGRVKEELKRHEGSPYSYDYDEEGESAPRLNKPDKKAQMTSKKLALDTSGAARTTIENLPQITHPHDIQAELEFRDPNGEIQTVSSRIPLWPSRVVVGIKPDSWATSREALKFQVAALDISGKPIAGKTVKVEAFQRKHYSHRKRLIGGFYAYEHATEVKKIGPLCEGVTNNLGLLLCDVSSPASGNVIIQAEASDDEGNKSSAHRDVWVAGKNDWWFDVSDNDRIDLLPEKKRYEPGETARLQLRMPFRTATVLIAVEREGVIDTYVKQVSGKKPTIEVPIKKNYAPNVFISAFCVRGRIGDVKPTTLVDLGKPAFKLGIAEIKVGRKDYELKVNVSTERETYKVREKVPVKVKVLGPDGKTPPKGSEVAIAAVDEGLLELMPNKSWQLLEAMTGHRGYEVSTSTAQMQVVGKRHYGLKALPHGGGGGKQITREMFDTLLLWKGRVRLNDKGEATVEVPLNDALTSFRIVAVANGGTRLFGTGQTSIRTTQDLMLIAGLPPVVREGDRFRAGFTVRNSTDKSMTVALSAEVSGLGKDELPVIEERLGPGDAKEIAWDVRVPNGIETLSWNVRAVDKEGTVSDATRVRQRVLESVRARPMQATITQIDRRFETTVERSKDAIPGKGGIEISLKPKLGDGLPGVTSFMKQYPYSCLEQKISKAIALRDKKAWDKIIAELPAHLDSDGLAKYFPAMPYGSDTLTSYLLSISDEAEWIIPEGTRERMEKGLGKFIEGKITLTSTLPRADLTIRRVAALEALSRTTTVKTALLSIIQAEPNLWPTSAVIDWINTLTRMPKVPNRDKLLNDAEMIIRSRLNFHGTTMGFSTEKTDDLWWLMISNDVNAVRTILTFIENPRWKEDIPRLVRSVLARQYRGAWNITTANAWGVLAMDKFSRIFESVPVTGSTSAVINNKTKTHDWKTASDGGKLRLQWPDKSARLNIEHNGTGKPWASLLALSAVPLKTPFSSGYTIKKTVKAIEQKEKGQWNRGDVIRVRLDIEAQSDMTWVVVNDPVPASSRILGTGLGRDSQILADGEKQTGWVYPVFEERAFDSFRAYYEFVPQGKWSVEYTYRLNNAGTFNLPETIVEAMYSPEMRAEIPNGRVEVGE